jgi:hypothetical protein
MRETRVLLQHDSSSPQLVLSFGRNFQLSSTAPPSTSLQP